MASSLPSQVDALPAGHSERWSVHGATAENDEELLQLFEKVFGHVMSASQWRWKYADAPTRGMMLRRDGTAVAFFGGMPRTIQGPSGTHIVVQNGDVMVLPSERGVFSRRGALYHVAAAFFSQLVGPSLGYEFAFGFPSGRHFQLGIKLGLYAPAGRMTALTWPALLPSQQRWSTTATLDKKNLHLLQPLWRDMRTSWPQYFMPVRDAARWNSRFASHPVHHYELLVIRRRWTGRPLCAIALREHAGHVEWLDYVGSSKATGLAVNAARRFAGERNKKPVMGLFSEGIAPYFAIDAASCMPSDIYIPVNARPVEEGRPYIGQLWLTGGDTDFL
ncbi:Acetyltransferase (GNAT) domain-containing protein [Polaromonas sp. OV174]|uniref:GNAT family N-acetyltransferase n=1 Tax=Polaromonas sp. OV174 TaxID=1855300 RepID=UPI0008E4AD3D|nr:GNAT family N-acetyltransferase [Polaromonas sp. OV174]SFC17232.1 Acetyltransferase (GNAT) domain-containing protein [Polaromonas sp. OV174]